MGMALAKTPRPHRYPNTARSNNLIGSVAIDPGSNQIWRSSVSDPRSTVLQGCSIGNEDIMEKSIILKPV